MAKMELNPMISSISGKMGGMIFRRLKNGTVVVSMAPIGAQAEPSPAQLKQRQKLQQAQVYARAALQDPELKSHYEQKAVQSRGKSYPYQLAVTDYLRGSDLLQRKQPGTE
jgi:hypothetical protein